MQSKQNLIAISKSYFAAASGSKFVYTNVENFKSTTLNYFDIRDLTKIQSISVSNKYLALSTEDEGDFSLMLFDLETKLFINKQNLDDRVQKLSMTETAILAVFNSSVSVYSVPTLEKIMNVGTMSFDSPPFVGSIVEIHNNYTAFENLRQSTWSLVAASGFVPGSIRIYQTFSESNKNSNIQRTLNSNAVTIQAHQHPLQIVQFSNNAKLIATASKSGKIIRIFNTITGELVHSFQRGSFESKIENIVFSSDDLSLSCFGSNGIFHTFDLSTDQTTIYDNQSQKFKLKLKLSSQSIACIYKDNDDVLTVNQKGKMTLIHTNINNQNKIEKNITITEEKGNFSLEKLK